MLIIKNKIMSKFLSNSNQFKYYKNNFNKLKKENGKLKKSNVSLKKKNSSLRNELDFSNQIINDLKNFYILNKDSLKNNQSNSKKKLLYVLHSGSGGTPKNVFDISKNITVDFDIYLLTANNDDMILYHFIGNEFRKINEWTLYSGWYIEKTYIMEYSNIYLNILINYSIDMVHIHHLLFHTFDLPRLCKELEIPVILSIHDLYFICPAYTLLDGDLKFCHGKCINSRSEKNCFMPMSDISKIKNMKSFVYNWRYMVSQMFSDISYFITPTNYIKNILFENYDLDENNFSIIEHGLELNEVKEELFEIPSIEEPTKILFLGNLHPQKGINIIKELYDIDKDSNLEFHFLGFTPSYLKNIGIHHGKYDYEDLYEHIKNIKPSFIGIFSICAESFSFTLSEAWNFGIPVLVSKLGALEERVLENDGGWFINIYDMDETYNIISSIIGDQEKYCSKQKQIQNIQLKSIDSMVEDYLQIYNNINY
ncbi:glycosyltransferase [uncultured Methanobrevibacter sp.]|uniref:glycosyltransferase n=1 Tax=uncultured Methanobrevibacter sp. TaxID=253161 RepID=UPI0025D7A394|nr:glycosyltransferase [uncultured Methanobrevibacter sp.]